MTEELDNNITIKIAVVEKGAKYQIQIPSKDYIDLGNELAAFLTHKDIKEITGNKFGYFFKASKPFPQTVPFE